jgi:hypothetical protein
MQLDFGADLLDQYAQVESGLLPLDLSAVQPRGPSGLPTYYIDVQVIQQDFAVVLLDYHVQVESVELPLGLSVVHPQGP